MIYFKGLLIFCLIAFVEVLHGIFRAKIIARLVGDFKSRQIGVLSGSILIIIISYFSISWIGPSTIKEALFVGAEWFWLMLLFELSLGRYVFKFSWKRLFADFNLKKGGLLGIGMLVLFLAPLISGFIQGLWK